VTFKESIMIKTLPLILATVGLMLSQPALTQQTASNVQTLRGTDAAVADKAPGELPYAGRRPGSQKPIERTFSTQPPLIPHAIENFDDVSLSENQCIECHGPEGAKKKSAPVVGERHFVTGSKTTLSQARYACVMCHVPQADAKPLVENSFVGDRRGPAR
jgi:cytochrome c-type protein NapB